MGSEVDINRVLSVDFGKSQIRIGGVLVAAALTQQESRVLKALYESGGNFVSKRDLALALWPEEREWIERLRRLNRGYEQRVEQVIFRLRQKLEPNRTKPQYLLSVRGYGCRLDRSGGTSLPATGGESPRSEAPAQAAAVGTADGARSPLTDLWNLAHPSDRIWPVPAEEKVATHGGSRGLGAPQVPVQHTYRLGSRLHLAVEVDTPGFLLLLDEGPEGATYCLVPSWFAPVTQLQRGVNLLPQAGSRYDAFVATGVPGREQLVAVISDTPLGLEWMPQDARTPARTLSRADCALLLERLHALPPESWTALSTYFDVTD